MSEQDLITKLPIFQFSGVDVRIYIDEQERLWWVAQDVLNILGYVNHRQTIARLDDDDKGVQKIPTPSSAFDGRGGGLQQMVCVNEFGLYALIFGSRRPEAKPFRKWMTHDVFPAIMRHGVYRLAQHQSLLDARIADLEAQLAVSQARAERYHALVPLTVSHGPSRSVWKRHLPAIMTFLKARTEFIWYELLDALDLPRYPNDHEYRLSLALLDVGWHPREKPPWKPGMLWDKQELLQRWAYTGVCFGRTPKPPITPTALTIHRESNAHA